MTALTEGSAIPQVPGPLEPLLTQPLEPVVVLVVCVIGAHLARIDQLEHVRRAIRLPAGTDGGEAAATYTEGILTVRFPMSQAAEEKTVHVTVA